MNETHIVRSANLPMLAARYYFKQFSALKKFH